MKKNLLMVLALGYVLATAACGGGGDISGPTDPTPTPTPVTHVGITVTFTQTGTGVIQPDANNVVRMSATAGGQICAEFSNPSNLSFTGNITYWNFGVEVSQLVGRSCYNWATAPVGTHNVAISITEQGGYSQNKQFTVIFQ